MSKKMWFIKKAYDYKTGYFYLSFGRQNSGLVYGEIAQDKKRQWYLRLEDGELFAELNAGEQQEVIQILTELNINPSRIASNNTVVI